MLEFDPPRRPAYTRDEDQLILKLIPTGTSGCALTLTNVLAAKDAAAR